MHLAALLRFMTQNVTRKITFYTSIQIDALEARTRTISRKCNYACGDFIHAFRERAHSTLQYNVLIS